METKIAELTRALYQEGVEKGEKKALDITAEAKIGAARIVADAEQEAAHLKAKAEKECAELRRTVDAEIKLSASQAFNSFKQQVLDSLVAKAVDGSIAKSMADPGTVADFIKTALQNWKVAASEAPDFAVMLPEAKKAELDTAVRTALSQTLSKGVEMRFSKTIKAGFRIGPKDGSFAVSFTEDDFKEFFNQYVRPKARNYLFGE